MSLEYNEDELVAPEWLTADYFNQVLRESEQDDKIEVKDIAISPATFKGDHFASIMFRARLQYQQAGKQQMKSVILKIMPTHGDKNAMLKESPVFITEIGIYQEVLPKIEAILKAAGDDSVLAPRCLYSSLSPYQILIFDDLVPMGYDVIREREIEFAEIKLACRHLAKWHAVSHKLAIETPEAFDKYRYGMLSMDNPAMSAFMYSGMDYFIAMLDETPELQAYMAYFTKIKPNFYETCKSYFSEFFTNRDSRKPYVLCHGDFHAKNIMFSKQPFDVKLIDFQASYMGPQVMDIIYLLMAVLPPVNILKHRNEIIYSYFNDYVETLKNIGFSGHILKLSELRSQLMAHRYFEIYLAVTFLPMGFALFMGKDISKSLFDSESRKEMYRIELFQKELKSLLPYYVHMGYFEE